MTRKNRVSLLLCFAMLAMLISGFIAPAYVSAYSTPNSRGGVNGQWYFGTQAELNTAADNVVATGMQWVRIDLKWDIVQAGGATSYDWSWPDKMVNTALSRGLKVLLVASYAPSWANGGNADTRYYPNAANINAWKNFLDLAARRYMPLGVTAYELWNEPNYSVQSSPSLFVSNILIPGSTALRAASSDLHIPVTIVDGAPANLINTSGIVDPYDWVTQIYANGGKDYFDVQAIHPYCWPAAPTTPSVWNALLRANEIHAIMANNGDGGKQVWATEFGYPTSGPNTVTEQQQSDYIVSAFQVWTQSAWQSWTGPMFLYTYKDGSTNLNDPESNFGLLRNNNTFKPVMSQLLTVMTNTPPAPTPPTSGYGGSTPPTGGTTVTYEAESGTYGGGGQQQNATNASGGKVVGNLNSVGAYSQVGSVNGGSGGNATLVIRYANGNGGASTLSLYVNGTKIQQTSYAATGGWNTFGNTANITIPLNAGTSNTIKIQRDSGDTPAADIDKFTVTTTGSSALTINGFENVSQWAGEATRTADTTKKTEGAQSIKFHYTVPSSGWANGYYNIASPYVDISGAASLKLDVYPTSQTPSGQAEPITLKLQDQAGGVIYEDRLPNLTANQWNTVTVNLSGIPQASRHQLNSVNLYLYSGFTAQINGRTSLDYYFDNLRVQ
ncbi:carbohydrate-binding protein [Paenibacillus glycinis]|uniref:Carbohydrate-binding protein n=1 Tax=Paenibacillus glycinis TaxID=2697035 RepID=A0ABW9XS07_9BACL|nr:carbohydrate-binding protein [Paenibacillus glycinis]NBD25447.1 carbohydrate-binding protein [Paenibacillus glycinis]